MREEEKNKKRGAKRKDRQKIKNYRERQIKKSTK
jgi:hypothetical protein